MWNRSSRNSTIVNASHCLPVVSPRSLIVVLLMLFSTVAWGQTVVSYNFDASSTAGWTFVDSDGDGYDWRLA